LPFSVRAPAKRVSQEKSSRPRLHHNNPPRTFALPIRNAEQERPPRQQKKESGRGLQIAEKFSYLCSPLRRLRVPGLKKSLLSGLQTKKFSSYLCSPLQPEAGTYRRKAQKETSVFA
jgi:hypothetical protein